MNKKQAKWVRIPLTKYSVLQHGIMNLYWDFDRLSTSGQECLEDMARLLDVPTEEEMNSMDFEKEFAEARNKTKG
jgi:hypothetical protein